MHKSRSSYRDGYKAHLAVEPETGIITAAELTPANVGDGPIGVGLLAGEPIRACRSSATRHTGPARCAPISTTPDTPQ